MYRCKTAGGENRFWCYGNRRVSWGNVIKSEDYANEREYTESGVLEKVKQLFTERKEGYLW